MTKQKKLANETPTEGKFFELFYVMGDRRNINQLLPLAKKVDPKVSYARLQRVSVKNWWNDRIKARDYNLLVTMKQSAAKDIDGLKFEFFERIRNTIKKIYVNEKGEDKLLINITDFSDLERAIKLMLLLAGEATDIHSIKIEVVETIIQHVINVVSLYVSDPKILSQIALELNKGIERN